MERFSKEEPPGKKGSTLTVSTRPRTRLQTGAAYGREGSLLRPTFVLPLRATLSNDFMLYVFTMQSWAFEASFFAIYHHETTSSRCANKILSKSNFQFRVRHRATRPKWPSSEKNGITPSPLYIIYRLSWRRLATTL